MKRAGWAVVALVAVLSSALTALVMATLMAPEAADSSQALVRGEASAETPETPGTSDLERRVDELEREN